jgi:hypothetical protein
MTVDVANGGRPSRRPRRKPAVDRPAARRRLDVLAGTVDDVVHRAGGWLADRALAGWDVEVLVADPGLDATTVRPLQILGASACSLRDESSSHRRPRADAVAVAADLFTADAQIRERVVHAYDKDLLEVIVWGDVIPTELSARFATVEHVLSSAAQAFKAHAMRAATPFATHPVGVTEMFCTGALRGLADDLIPAASG